MSKRSVSCMLTYVGIACIIVISEPALLYQKVTDCVRRLISDNNRKQTNNSRHRHTYTRVYYVL